MRERQHEPVARQPHRPGLRSVIRPREDTAHAVEIGVRPVGNERPGLRLRELARGLDEARGGRLRAIGLVRAPAGVRGLEVEPREPL